MSKFAVVSVSDKAGLEPFVRGLVKLGFTILSTGGTAKFLTERGITVKSVSEHTGQPEIMDGRVKTLHPKILGGVLARRNVPNDLKELEAAGISAIDLIVVNLYPFTQKVREVEQAGVPGHESLIETIDIGGPTMIRAAGKNCHFVVPVVDPNDYDRVLTELNSSEGVPLTTRRYLASKVFTMMAAYDVSIARYFSLEEQLVDQAGKPQQLAPTEGIVLRRVESLRYGENPHQQAALYREVRIGEEEPSPWKQLQGKELSYNNILDMHAALDLFLEVRTVVGKRHAAVIIKHSNPCGVAVGDNALQAYELARACDPVSAFGGIVAVSGELDERLAECILEGFVEVVLVEKVTSGGLQAFQKKKNVRVLQVDFDRLSLAARQGWISTRNSFGDYLLQSNDRELVSLKSAKVAHGDKPSPEMLADLELAWAISKHVKSNAITIVKNLQLVGVGAGQMNRVDSARFAISRAQAHGHSVKDAVAGSDAFLPFPDTLEVLSDAGVVALVQPGGSIKDEAVVQAATECGMLLLMTGERHFRH